MSPKDDKNKKSIQDSTTDFFLKVIQKEKEESRKEISEKDNNETKMKMMNNKVTRFYNYINQTFDKILSSKMSVMLLSFLIAALLFYSISGQDILSSPTSGTTLEKVPVVVENLNDSLELSGVPETVTVGVIGPSVDIYKMNFSNDYVVYLDLKDYTKGEYTVNLKSRNFPESLKVMLVPNTLTIKLAPKTTSKFELGYRFINEDQLDTKYSVSVSEMSETTVSIRASRDTLQRIARVEANIDVGGQTEAFEQEAKIKVYDTNDKVMNVELSPTSVHVKCDVASYSKVVPVYPNFVGDLPAGYEISHYTLSQNQVTIYGVEEKIKDITSVSIDVDVSNVKSNTTITGVPFKRGNGINKFSSKSLDVTLEVEKVITKKFEKIPIKVLNNTKGYKVSFAGESGYATVSVTGPEAKVAALTAANIQATIDIDGLNVGTRNVKVNVAVDDDKIKIVLLSSEKVTINIERK